MGTKDQSGKLKDAQNLSMKFWEVDKMKSLAATAVMAGFAWFPSVSPGRLQERNPIRLLPLSSKSFPVH
jgi:hypothetical protein